MTEKMKLQYVATPGVSKVLDAAQSAIITTDGLSNVVAGLGGGNDKRTYNQWSHKNDPFNDFSALEAMYRNSWIAKQIVDVPANDATREWRKFKGEHADKIEKEEKRLRIQTQYNDLIKNARLYGGGLMLMITGQDLGMPLNLNKIKEGDLKKVIVFDRWYLSGAAINITNPLSDNFLKSEYYFLAGTGQRVHHSHLIRLNGSFLPMRLNQFEQGFGDSVLRKCQDDISDVSSTNANIANLVFEANVDTIKRKGLFSALATGEDQKIINRYSKLKLLKSTLNLTLLDEDETYERNQLSFSGLPQIQQTQMQWISGSADIPMTRLFGSSPGGLNATGESDLNNYYDSVKSDQEGQYREGLEQLDQVMLRSAGIQNPDNVEFEWNPLYQDSNTEKSTQRLADAQTDQIYLERGVLTEAQVAKRLQSNGDYAIEDADISELESLRDEENERLEIENEELRNQAAANEDKFNAESERAEKAISDANATIIGVRKNFSDQTARIQSESDKLVNDAQLQLVKIKDEYEQKITDAAVTHKEAMDAKVNELLAETQTQVEDKNAAFEVVIENLKAKHENDCAELQSKADTKIADIETEYNKSVEDWKQKVSDAESKGKADVEEAEAKHAQLVADAEAAAQQSIDEAKEQNVVDIKMITDGVNKLLADQKAQYDQELESAKAESVQQIALIKEECKQTIDDAAEKANDRINELQSSVDKKIEDSKIDVEALETVIFAKAYQAIKDEKKSDENQDDEVNNGDQSNGNADGTDDSKPDNKKGDGEAENKDESAKADGAE